MAKKKTRPSAEKALLDSIGVAELPEPAQWLSTGCTILDLAVADRLPGGFAAGRVSQVYGWESTGKSVIGACMLGSVQRMGGVCVLVDSEGTFDVHRAGALYGVDTHARFIYAPCQTLEGLYDKVIASMCEARAADDPKRLAVPWGIVVDTMSALTTDTEQDQSLTDGTYGTKAKVNSTALRKWIGRLNRYNIAVLFVDQVREKISRVPGLITIGGGRSVQFYASTRVQLKFETKVQNTHKATTGVWVRFVVTKNKIAAPFREGMFRILFDYGIDDTATSLSWLQQNGGAVACSDKGGWWTYRGVKAQGFDKFVKAVEDAGHQDKLVVDVASRWKDVYSSVPRKERAW